MNVRPSRKSFLTLESVAMTDIVMNLFIFFFVSFSLLYTFNPHKESKIEVKLPAGAAAPQGARAESRPLVVSVTSGNEVFFESRRVPPERLKAELDAQGARLRADGVLVRADRAASVEVLVKVLDAAKQSGAAKLGVAIEPE